MLIPNPFYAFLPHAFTSSTSSISSSSSSSSDFSSASSSTSVASSLTTTPAADNSSLGVEDTPTPILDPHLWGFLSPLTPVLKRIDLWKLNASYDIGRDPCMNMIVLPGMAVSGRHCTLRWSGSECTSGSSKGPPVTVTDHSTNGTYVNGVRVGMGKSVILRDEDEIALGGVAVDDYRYTFHSPFSPSTHNVDTSNPLLAGYTVVSLLGKGSFGEVFKVPSRDSGVEYARKVFSFRRELGSKPEEDRHTQLIAREITLLQQFSHPNICAFIEFISPLALVMEFVEGSTLFSYIKSHGPLNEPLTKDLTYQICEGMTQMHELGVSHRDLKPENILLTSHTPPIVKIADFGLARVVRLGSRMMSAVGSPGYVAPEIYAEFPEFGGYDEKCDSWSVGVVLYNMLTASNPTPNPDNAHITISNECRGFLEKLLKRDPNERLALSDARYTEWLQEYRPCWVFDRKDGGGREPRRNPCASYISPEESGVCRNSRHARRALGNIREG